MGYHGLESIRVDTYIPILQFIRATRVDIHIGEIREMQLGSQAMNIVTWTVLEYCQGMIVKSCYVIGHKTLTVPWLGKIWIVVDLKV